MLSALRASAACRRLGLDPRSSATPAGARRFGVGCSAAAGRRAAAAPAASAASAIPSTRRPASRGPARTSSRWSTSPSFARSFSSVTSLRIGSMAGAKPLLEDRGQSCRAVPRRALGPIPPRPPCRRLPGSPPRPAWRGRLPAAALRSFSRACSYERLLIAGDVAHVVFGHVDFQLPIAGGIGHAEQDLAPLDRPIVRQPVVQVPSDDLAVDGAFDVQLQLLLLLERQLRFEADQFLLQLRLLAGQPVAILGAKRSCCPRAIAAGRRPTARWRPAAGLGPR